MRNVNKFSLSILFVCAFFNSFGQRKSDKLQKEQEKLEKSISVTRSLLKKTTTNTTSTLNEIKVLDAQLKYREELIVNYDGQIKFTELKIDEKKQQIETLETKLTKLIIQYKELLLYSYKHRSQEANWMIIISAKNFNQAFKRKKYLEKIAALQVKQKIIILKHKEFIHEEKKDLESEKKRKELIAEQKRNENENIKIDKLKQEQNFTHFKSLETKLKEELKLNENKKIILKQRIKDAINNELALEESKRKAKENKVIERKTVKSTDTKTTERKSNEKELEPENTVSEKAKPVGKKTVVFLETKELALNQNFENNRGRLPWPVEKGTITENFGRNAHSKIPNIFTNNNGIDISTTKNATIRSVFEGEVTSVLSIPGAGKVVIIKHGNYRTVYSNLQECYVSAGMKVSTKQVVGSLLLSESETMSVAHFEIHHISGGQINRINPNLWIAK